MSTAHSVCASCIADARAYRKCDRVEVSGLVELGLAVDGQIESLVACALHGGVPLTPVRAL